jgi:hypothetical protein
MRMVGKMSTPPASRARPAEKSVYDSPRLWSATYAGRRSWNNVGMTSA